MSEQKYTEHKHTAKSADIAEWAALRENKRMIVTNEKLINRLLSSSVKRKIRVEIPNVVLKDEYIIEDSFELKFSKRDEETSGPVSQVTFSLTDTNVDLEGKEIKIYIAQSNTTDVLYPSDTLFPGDDLYPFCTDEGEYLVFSGIIDSAERQKNQSVIGVTTYRM